MLNIKTSLLQFAILFSIGILVSCGGNNDSNQDESKDFDAAKSLTFSPICPVVKSAITSPSNHINLTLGVIF